MCVYCGGVPETRDHVPSKILLDDPFSDNTPVVGACRECNQGFSLHEEYVACLLEAVIVGDTAPTSKMRSKVQKALERGQLLAARIKNSSIEIEESIWWKPESERMEIVIRKLAQGHAAFELSETVLGEPYHLDFRPFPLMNEGERSEFERMPEPSLWPEVGSRAMIQAATNLPGRIDPWRVIQPQRYRYALCWDSEIIIKIVMSEYLACEVRWN